MKIMPINNRISQQTQFKAKFSKQDVNHFLKEIEGNDIDIVPKLYTMLSFIKELPGKNAKILPSEYRPWYQLQIDNVSITQGRYYLCAYHALLDATVQSGNSSEKVLYSKKMTKENFIAKFYENSQKTIKDIEKLFEE